MHFIFNYYIFVITKWFFYQETTWLRLIGNAVKVGNSSRCCKFHLIYVFIGKIYSTIVATDLSRLGRR